MKKTIDFVVLCRHFIYKETKLIMKDMPDKCLETVRLVAILFFV